ncbi:hypothetical protein NliqN6_6445 [Naganishia liquefaciens]|uniref:Yippee domain-containing protein n=1 Tax=Naganishia liquefaciens TaxID=104408 RepID=A0A8H3TZP3_9TREE|nr:hypothetical protein NliqN6_6445 [Naganishia liquefaciens]
MRFFASAAGPSSARPRPSSSLASSSSSSTASLFGESPSSPPLPLPMPHAPPPTRAMTGLGQAVSCLPLSPAGSLSDHTAAARRDGTQSSRDANPASTGPIRPNLAAFPESLHGELEEYDRRASRADPIHYFSNNRHAQYVCRECIVPLALQDEVVSKAFSGSLGQAYLLHSTVNTYLGKKEEKRLLTGMHTVADLLCMGCQQLGRKTTVGWMYLQAKERDQRYKEGKYILEAARVFKENNWSLDD